MPLTVPPSRVAFVAMLLATAACGNPGAKAAPPTVAPTAVASVTTSAAAGSPDPAGGPGRTADAPAAAPPRADVTVDGGDPVPGQLGSYTWLGIGSDSPWLPGTPIRVGAGEPLTMTFAPAIAPVTWRGRFVPAEQADAAGARSLSDGTASPPSFVAPPAGRWTVQVEVVFAAGSAAYFWRMEGP